MAIHLKKKLSTVRATEAICSKVNFSRVSIPKLFCHYFASNDLLFLSGHVTKFVNKCIMNTVTDLCSFVAIFAYYGLIIDSIEIRFIKYLRVFFKWPTNVSQNRRVVSC